MDPKYFDPITITAKGLQDLLQRGEITSVQIVSQYLHQIEKHDSDGAKLNAMISIVPKLKLFTIAAALDAERTRGKVRSALHGVPIVLKDNIMTDPGLDMPTTVGSHAFATATVKKAALTADRLTERGLIIIGKTNLTEFCGLKTTGMMPGYSTYGGQTQSPYVMGGLVEGELMLGHSAPGGSSTGSAVAVAAGFAPLAIGTETVGSIVTPANRAALYALKFTVGSLPMDGVFGISRTFDTLGHMAKSAGDLALLAKVMREDHVEERLLVTNGLAIGFVDPSIWSMAPEMCPKTAESDEQMRSSYETAIATLRTGGHMVKYPVKAPLPSTLMYKGQSMIQYIAFQEFKSVFADFAKGYDPETSSIKSVADMVSWNEKHADLALPVAHSNQTDLIAARDNSTTEEETNLAIAEMRCLGREAGIDAVMETNGLDFIAAPGDSSLCILAAAAGYPLLMVPLDVLNLNGRPFGICIIAKAGQEEKLLAFASSYETLSPARPLPLALLG